MNRDQLDKLIDAGLKQYSHVDPPEQFTERLLRRAEEPRPRRRWLWVPVPVAAAVVLLFVISKPAPLEQPFVPVPPPKVAPAPTRHVEKPPLTRRAQARMPALRPRPHELSPEELASMRLPAELFAGKPAPAEIVVPDLNIPDLQIAEPEKTLE